VGAPEVRRHFLPWDRPLPEQAAAYLASDWSRSGPIDLSRLLVVVPTRQSGRRLREALSELASAHGQAAFPPRIVTPDQLIVPAQAAGVASRAESLLAWVEVLRRMDPGEFREVFPSDPPDRSFGWALRLARTFVGLQAALAEADLCFADVAARAGDDFPEAGRWTQLGELEAGYLGVLARIGRTDAEAARRAAAASPPAVEGVDRIVVVAVPDPVPLAVKSLEAHSRVLPVEVLVYADPKEGETFDAWGRPVESAWARRELDLPGFENCVRLCADPEAQADRVVEAARGYPDPDGSLAVGSADPSVLPHVEAALGRAGLAAFNPEGVLRRNDGLYQLVSALSGLAGEPTFAALGALARCPDILAFLGDALGGDFSVEAWLTGLDELHAAHFPADLAAARARAAAVPDFAGLGPALDLVEELRGTLAAGGPAKGGSEALVRIFGSRRLDLGSPSDSAFEDSAAAWMNAVRDASSARGRFPGTTDSEAWTLALDAFAEARRTGDKPDGALELQGWLELLFEDAPHLVVAGCNEGLLPGAVTGDPFLPELLRTRLGLKGNAGRFARDAYVLQAIAACRSRTGRLELLVGKVSGDRDPLRPSRLLFRCADPELPGRVRYLFRPAEKARPSPPWGRAWVLRPQDVEPRRLERLPATAFRDYLQCPFRFYLKHLLGLRPFDPEKTELDTMDFGILCHEALGAMGGEPALRHSTNAAELRDFLVSRLDSSARDRFGARLPVPLVVQLESARQRLSGAAAVQALERGRGWIIEETEKEFTVGIGGLTVTAKIDRIDRNERTGERRVLDYKTSDRAESPRDAHAQAARTAREAPDFSRFRAGEREMAWVDLQLPIYRQALGGSGGGPVAVGYFNLPKAVGETSLALWDDYTPDLHASAMRCAEGVVAGVRARKFWPPAESVEHDDSNGFAGLFHQGVLESVDRGFAGEVASR
jgi:ATP-dependent helicase/nuclease subunit B